MNKYSQELLSKIGIATLTSIITIIGILNISSWLIGVIWLALLGEWWLIISGLLLSFAMPYVFSIIMMPTLLTAGWLTIAYEKKQKTIIRILAFLSTIYQYGILMYWVIYVYDFFLSNNPNISIIPLILYGYSTMSAPLVSMARGEDRESTGTFMGILICEVSYFLIVILNIFGLSKGNINTILWIGIFSFAIYLSNSLLPEAETVEKGDIIEEAEIIELRNECKTCGAITKRSTKFCSKCGNKI